MHRQRVQYGGRVYDHSGGIKPFIKSVRDGYLGYYLPDEDLGREHSVFVDFFATQKQQFRALGRLSKLSKAKIVPLFAQYDINTGQYTLDFYPALPFPTGSEELDTYDESMYWRLCEQKTRAIYVDLKRLLKTRPDSNINPYNK